MGRCFFGVHRVGRFHGHGKRLSRFRFDMLRCILPKLPVTITGSQEPELFWTPFGFEVRSLAKPQPP